jgi:hypothetical protein
MLDINLSMCSSRRSGSRKRLSRAQTRPSRLRSSRPPRRGLARPRRPHLRPHPHPLRTRTSTACTSALLCIRTNEFTIVNAGSAGVARPTRPGCSLSRLSTRPRSRPPRCPHRPRLSARCRTRPRALLSRALNRHLWSPPLLGTRPTARRRPHRRRMRQVRAARFTSSLLPSRTARPRSRRLRTSRRKHAERSNSSALVPLHPLFEPKRAEPGAESEHAAAQGQEEQRKTATLQARVQELEPQVQELLDTRPKLAALEAARESLHASLKQLEEEQSSKLLSNN